MLLLSQWHAPISKYIVRDVGLIQSVSQASWPELPASFEVSGIAPFPYQKPPFLQPIST